jgi:hypothetical protein
MARNKPARRRHTGTCQAEISRHLRLGVAALTDPDEGRREAAVASALRMVERPALRLLIDRLVRRVKGRDSVARRQAARSLAGLGEAAVPALQYALWKSRDAGTQVLLVQVLTAIAKTLPRPQRSRIQWDLAIAQERTTSLEVMAAVARADQELWPRAGDPGTG